jgi:dTDP-4-dehydrorhamnose reductase
VKKILVTGSNGLLGQKLSDIYLDKDVIYYPTGLGECRHPRKGEMNYHKMDITSSESVNSVIRELKPDCIINTAAMTNVDECESKKEECVELNINAVKYLSEAANEVGAKLVHLSTDFIFDGKDGPYKEDAEPMPLSYYGWSKLEGEKIVKSTCKDWAIARTVLVYGVVNDMSRSNIVLWAKGALEKGQEINVVDDQYRTPTLAEDLANGVYLIENSNAQGVFNISGKDFMSIYELVERVAKYFDLSMTSVSRIKSDTLNQAAKRPPITGFDLTKSRNELGYLPHSFEQGMSVLMQQVSV